MTLKNRTLEIIRSRHTVLWMGWLLPQIMLLGPALIGLSVLVPCDLLALPGFYLPVTEEYSAVSPGDVALTDLVVSFSMARDFTTREYRAGRIPLWQPANYCGAPFAGWPKYSPFELLYALFPDPATLAWIQMLQSVGFGLGLWLFLTRSLSLSFWPATIVSWCAPWTAFLVVWQGYPVAPPVCWLPWLLLAVDDSVKRPFGSSSITVALVTALVLHSGQPDMGGLVLLTSGLRVVWLIGADFIDNRQLKKCCFSALSISGGWLAGFLLAAPLLLPLVDYMGTGGRVSARATGMEERPPIGLNAVWGLLLPEADGGSRHGSVYIGRAGNILESSSGAYAGLIAVLWLVPLAVQNRRRRKETVFWALLAVFALGWTLDVPGIVTIQRLPFLNMLSYNRWVFASAVSVLVLTAFGLEHLWENPFRFSRWFHVPMFLCLLFGGYCLFRTFVLPEPVATLPTMIRSGEVQTIAMSDVVLIQKNFRFCYATGAVLAGIAFAGWSMTIQEKGGRPFARIAIPLVLVGDLYLFAVLQTRQSDPDLYFPRIQALERLSQEPPGRILGIGCLPPSLNQTHGLQDIRGYDGVDPEPYVSLLNAVGDPSFTSPAYASTQSYVPMLVQTDDQIRLPPILNLLNTKYVIMRGEPAVSWPVIVKQDDYWVLENVDALPRAFVSETIEYVPDVEQALAKMASLSFDPRKVAFLHDSVPAITGGKGVVSFVHETPVEIELQAEMRNDGIVIISDRWDQGWKAYIDDTSVPVWRANVALRAIGVPAGKHRVLLRYEPNSVRFGFVLFFAGCLCITGFTLWKLRWK